ITTDPFIVYSSNIFAILGLRALYFALAGLVKLFHFLNFGLAFILSFIGVKMIVNHYFGKDTIPTEISLIVIMGTLLLSVLLSLKFPKKEVH
ncbi:MAG TPA: tellurium resistance protein TerC, partial [Bacteroidetes bacterium]|nr:tellurium resistance protein TerC [Bacteroidota bacterium]